MRRIVSSLHQELISVFEFRSKAETANLELVGPVRDQDTCRRVAGKGRRFRETGKHTASFFSVPNIKNDEGNTTGLRRYRKILMGFDAKPFSMELTIKFDSQGNI